MSNNYHIELTLLKSADDSGNNHMSELSWVIVANNENSAPERKWHFDDDDDNENNVRLETFTWVVDHFGKKARTRSVLFWLKRTRGRMLRLSSQSPKNKFEGLSICGTLRKIIATTE